MPIQTKKIAINGTELSYTEQGSGIPAVFVHGSLNDLRTWAFQMGPFSKCYHTIAISRRYHPNDFTDDGWDYSALNHAEDLAAFIEELGLALAHVVGHSFSSVCLCNPNSPVSGADPCIGPASDNSIAWCGSRRKIHCP